MKAMVGEPMRFHRWVLLFALCAALGSVARAQEPSEAHRKMVSRVVPAYPGLAQKMGISGSVKIEAVVNPNGTVKSTDILGGHPVLAQAGVDAVRRCKWEPTQHESHEIVVLNFHPE
jgi:TonB family protein